MGWEGYAGAAMSVFGGVGTPKPKIVFDNMQLLLVREGVYSFAHRYVDEEYKVVTGSLDEILDAIKVMVVTARIES